MKSASHGSSSLITRLARAIFSKRLWAYLRARARGTATSRVRGVSITFPVMAGSWSAFGRILEAPHKEPATQQWLAHIAEESPGATLWDVGANIGLFTLLGARLGLNVVAFEPLLTSQQLLQLALPLNGVGESVVAIPVGLSDRTRTATFAIRSAHPGITGSSIGVDIKAARYRITTVTMAGDDVRSMLTEPFNAPTAIKLDVDGIELQILDGLCDTLASSELRHVMVEEVAHESRMASKLAPFRFRISHEENTTPRRPGKHVNRHFVRSD